MSAHIDIDTEIETRGRGVGKPCAVECAGSALIQEKLPIQLPRPGDNNMNNRTVELKTMRVNFYFKSLLNPIITNVPPILSESLMIDLKLCQNDLKRFFAKYMEVAQRVILGLARCYRAPPLPAPAYFIVKIGLFLVFRKLTLV